MTPVSLNQQIEEVDRELNERKSVYTRLVYCGKMRQSVADFHTARMVAVKDTLIRLRGANADIRLFLALPEHAQKAAIQAGIDAERGTL